MGHGSTTWWGTFDLRCPWMLFEGDKNFSKIVTTFAFNIDQQGSSNGSVDVYYTDGSVGYGDVLTQNTSTGAKDLYRTLTVSLLKKPIEKIRFNVWRNGSRLWKFMDKNYKDSISIII